MLIVNKLQAESWLNSQAQAQGWDKAAKLQNRATLNGLIGITFNSRAAFMVYTLKTMIYFFFKSFQIVVLITLG